jgi:hypothetical protein
MLIRAIETKEGQPTLFSAVHVYSGGKSTHLGLFEGTTIPSVIGQAFMAAKVAGLKSQLLAHVTNF